jgi:ABC-2 type transport system permease protein
VHVRNVFWIMRRDLSAFLRAPMGYIVMFGALGLLGLLFNVDAVGSGARVSTAVLSRFFFLASGVMGTAAIFLSMRLIAEERQLGTLTLIMTSPVRDWQLVLGKFLSAVALLAILMALSVYMPLLIYINGKISVAHLFAGYLGVLLISSTALALGLLCSAVSPNQLVALILGAFLVGLFWLFWLISKIAAPPIEELVAYLSLHDKHFRPFMEGVVSLRDVVFYVSLIYVALLSATRVLESRRWQ